MLISRGSGEANMKSRILGFIIIVTSCGGAFTLMTFGQRGGPPPQLPRYLPSDKKFDAHDLAGIWTRNSSRLGYGGGGTCPDRGGRGVCNDVPPFTPPGQKMFYANKPPHGSTLGNPDHGAHPREQTGRRAAGPP